MIQKLIRDFYQYLRNSFDSIGQIANAGLLANKGKKVDKTDFPAMKDRFQQQTYSGEFPLTSAWFSKTDSDDEFKYIDEAIFDTENMDSLEKVIRTFVYSKGADRFKIFKQNVRDTLYPTQQ